jgi:hypothetical protein
MRASFIRFPLIIVAGVALFFACATPENIGGQCDGACYTTGINPQPEGSICLPSGICACPGGTYACCATGNPGKCQIEPCSLEDRCPKLDAGVDSAPKCASDMDCPQPPSKECGKGTCISGVCALEIHEGPTLSQKYGDCLRRECNAKGEAYDAIDTSDFYEDGDSCTLDYCDSATPLHAAHPDALPCPGRLEGYCLKGACVECIGWMPAAVCGSQKLYCDYTWCVPTAQCPAGSCGGPCAPCPMGGNCTVDTDCVSNSCSGGTCALGTCTDTKKNDNETGIDCGGACPPCPTGEACKLPSDCASHVCKKGVCQAPTCTDAEQNGDETGVDCGTPACGPCG